MKTRAILISVLTLIFVSVYSQKKETPVIPSNGYRFTPVIELKTTPVKDQASTGTCWSFATTSFIESELIRMGRGEFDLSEMFVVRKNYLEKLKDNFKQNGQGNLGQGSVGHDFMIEFTKNGIVPDEVYSGLNYGLPNHNHSELNDAINAVAKVPLQQKKESDQYLAIIDAILDIYLGKVPSSFIYRGVGYTPESFSASLGIKAEDYVEITSFTLFPFYTLGVVPIPDNWRKISYYNVPLDQLIQIMDYSLNNGYTIAWDGDVSEKGFSHANGVAIIPEVEKTDMYPDSEKNRLGKLSMDDLSAEAYKFSQPFTEVRISQELRQEWFDTKKTTDDHLMHVTGIVKDQNGTKYYITKNSWGTEKNPFGGYLNMSENYVRAKTISILVNKNAIPEEIKTKLGL